MARSRASSASGRIPPLAERRHRALDDTEARRVGLLLAGTHTVDVVDAHVAICGHRLGQAVLTSDPVDILRLAPSILVHRV